MISYDLWLDIYMIFIQRVVISSQVAKEYKVWNIELVLRLNIVAIEKLIQWAIFIGYEGKHVINGNLNRISKIL